MFGNQKFAQPQIDRPFFSLFQHDLIVKNLRMSNVEIDNLTNQLKLKKIIGPFVGYG